MTTCAPAPDVWIALMLVLIQAPHPVSAAAASATPPVTPAPPYILSDHTADKYDDSQSTEHSHHKIVAIRKELERHTCGGLVALCLGWSIGRWSWFSTTLQLQSRWVEDDTPTAGSQEGIHGHKVFALIDSL